MGAKNVFTEWTNDVCPLREFNGDGLRALVVESGDARRDMRELKRTLPMWLVSMKVVGEKYLVIYTNGAIIDVNHPDNFALMTELRTRFAETAMVVAVYVPLKEKLWNISTAQRTFFLAPKHLPRVQLEDWDYIGSDQSALVRFDNVEALEHITLEGQTIIPRIRGDMLRALLPKGICWLFPAGDVCIEADVRSCLP